MNVAAVDPLDTYFANLLATKGGGDGGHDTTIHKLTLVRDDASSNSRQEEERRRLLQERTEQRRRQLVKAKSFSSYGLPTRPCRKPSHDDLFEQGRHHKKKKNGDRKKRNHDDEHKHRDSNRKLQDFFDEVSPKAGKRYRCLTKRRDHQEDKESMNAGVDIEKRTRDLNLRLKIVLDKIEDVLHQEDDIAAAGRKRAGCNNKNLNVDNENVAVSPSPPKSSSVGGEARWSTRLDGTAEELRQRSDSMLYCCYPHVPTKHRHQFKKDD